MEQGYARITVCFEAPFWIGVLEREWGGTLEVCKIVFGAEPRDYEVYAFLMSHWRELRFSPPVTGVRRAEAANPKRCLLYTSPSPRDRTRSRMPSSA